MTNRPATIIAMIAAVAGPDVQIRKNAVVRLERIRKRAARTLRRADAQQSHCYKPGGRHAAQAARQLSSRRAITCRSAFLSSSASSRSPVCRNERHIAIDGIDMERHASATIAVAHSPCGRAAEYRSRPRLSHDWDEPSSLGSRYFGPNPLSSNPRPSRTSLDFREGVTMQPFVIRVSLSAHPPLPAKSRSAAARNGG